jgi:MFS family permease
MAIAVSDIPGRLDSLPWSRWHWRVIMALGIAWVLDGLEVTLIGSIGSVLERQDTLSLTASQVGWTGSLYVGGAVIGALIFGRLTDRLGRKKLFMITLMVYMAATLATAFAMDFPFLSICRFITGFGIGGEYAAINSAIDELIPARVRGRVNLMINASFWIGAALGAALSLILLDPHVLGPRLGWRACFILGAVMAVAIVLVRRHVPESPRWLLMHGKAEQANQIVEQIEAQVRQEVGNLEPVESGAQVSSHGAPPLRQVTVVLLQHYRMRSLLVLTMMIAQAFIYNAIFFTYSLVLTRFYQVPDNRVALYIFPFALGNVLGPMLLGHLFDSLGRRKMISLTYILSGIGLAITGLAFMAGWLTAWTLALCWTVVFFFWSTAASSAYLTVSEVFPLEMRALVISIFYAIGTGTGGFIAPVLFGWLIQSGSRSSVAIGYAIGAGLALMAGLLAQRHAVDAERKALEEVASLPSY